VTKQSLYKIIRWVYHKIPLPHKYRTIIHSKLHPLKPRFSGWGMTSMHELPWNDEYDGKIFRQAIIDVKKKFEFTNDATHINSSMMDELQWRQWIVSYATRHAIEFAKTDDYNFVECGVGDGFSSFFILREICGNKKTMNNYITHLYDSWDAMKKEDLLESELVNLGRYWNLYIDLAKRNLSEFKNVSYHKGYIPQSFESLPVPPTIVYLLIDLNSAKPTLDTLEFFYPRLVKGGVILFDDYGWKGFEDTKRIVDEFLHNKPGMLLKLPTGQAIYFH